MLSGELQFGLGDTFDASRLQKIPQGALIVLHENDPYHFAKTGPDGAQLMIVAGPEAVVAPEVMGTK